MTKDMRRLDTPESFLSSGLFKADLDQYMREELIHPTRGDSFYTRALKTGGEAAAQAALNQWHACWHMHDFSAAAESIIQGMLAVTRSGSQTEHALLVRPHDLISFPDIPFANLQGPILLFFNPEVPGCGCSQPPGAFIFGRNYGSLALHAITLQIGVQSGNRTVFQLGLVLPTRGFPGKVAKNQYTIFTIGTHGETTNHVYRPMVEIDENLRYCLGLISPKEAGFPSNGEKIHDGKVYQGGSTDEALGFPGAFKYLADHIGELGPYLMAAADQLTGNHKHH